MAVKAEGKGSKEEVIPNKRAKWKIRGDYRGSVDGNEEFHNVIVSAMLTMEDEGGLSEYYRQKRNWKITDNATGVENYFLGRRLECFVIAPKLGKIRHDFSAVTNSRWVRLGQLYACRLLSSYDPKYDASSLSDSSIPREVLRFKPNT
ncbi:LOW QUALITY PROTEIN: hypothetical protein V1477_002751 [Vespula maculifrons]|uniref:Uncharacterized protein n=1 Tax=Vespula maculifrons TaxID=7453 RepID=A0ABD2CVG9_VESMC